MSNPPTNDDEDFSDYITGELPTSFTDLIDALRANGSEVEVGLLDTEVGAFTPVAND